MFRYTWTYGLTTLTIHYASQSYEIAFDIISHNLTIYYSHGNI
jgi:hypothetical protein